MKFILATAKKGSEFLRKALKLKTQSETLADIGTVKAGSGFGIDSNKNSFGDSSLGGSLSFDKSSGFDSEKNSRVNFNSSKKLKFSSKNGKSGLLGRKGKNSRRSNSQGIRNNSRTKKGKKVLRFARKRKSIDDSSNSSTNGNLNKNQIASKNLKELSGRKNYYSKETIKQYKNKKIKKEGSRLHQTAMAYQLFITNTPRSLK